MRRVTLCLVLASACLVGTMAFRAAAEDKDEPKARGTLYPNWRKLGLTDDQVQEVYKVQTKYRNQIDKLESQIAALKKQERADAEKVLTPAQKQRLRELATGDDGDKDKKDDKGTPVKDKKDDKGSPVKDKKDK